MSASARLRRVVVPLAISAVVVALILATVDRRGLETIGDRIDPSRLPGVALLITLIVLLFSLRWHRLLGGRVTARTALVSTALGLGGNQVLPARGGDLARVMEVGRTGQVSVHFALSRLVVEKLMDLGAVAAMGAIALTALSAGDGRDGSLVTAGAFLLLVAAAFGLVRTGLVERTLAATARLLRIRPRLYRHVYRMVFHLRTAARGRALALPLAITIVLWMVLYARIFQEVGLSLAIPLTFHEAVLLAFVAALGHAIPAAPSSLGIFHASVISGFLLLGRPAAEGLLIAVGVHAATFLGYCAAGLVALCFAFARRPPPILHTDRR